MHILSNSVLKQYLTNGCTKWEISGTWNIASFTGHACVSTPRAGIAFAAAQDAAAPDVFAAPEERVFSFPGWAWLLQPLGSQTLVQLPSSLPGSTEGLYSPCTATADLTSAPGGCQHSGNGKLYKLLYKLYNQPRGLEDHLRLSSVKMHPAAILGITQQQALSFS